MNSDVSLLASATNRDTVVCAAREVAEADFGSANMVMRKRRIDEAEAAAVMKILHDAGVVAVSSRIRGLRDVLVPSDPDTAEKLAGTWWDTHAT